MNTNDTHGWMQTFTGKKVFPLNPNPDDICIEDIAHALSITCRYGGHCPRFYSVAQHSILASALASDGHTFAALMHDAAEAYIGDMIRPLKKFVPQFQIAEKRMEEVIFPKFGLPVQLPPEVKVADNMALMLERRELGIKPIASWGPELEALELPPAHPLLTKLFNTSMKGAETLFLELFSTYRK